MTRDLLAATDQLVADATTSFVDEMRVYFPDPANSVWAAPRRRAEVRAALVSVVASCRRVATFIARDHALPANTVDDAGAASGAGTVRTWPDPAPAAARPVPLDAREHTRALPVAPPVPGTIGEAARDLEASLLALRKAQGMPDEANEETLMGSEAVRYLHQVVIGQYNQALLDWAVADDALACETVLRSRGDAFDWRRLPPDEARRRYRETAAAADPATDTTTVFTQEEAVAALDHGVWMAPEAPLERLLSWPSLVGAVNASLLPPSEANLQVPGLMADVLRNAALGLPTTAAQIVLGVDGMRPAALFGTAIDSDQIALPWFITMRQGPVVVPELGSLAPPPSADGSPSPPPPPSSLALDVRQAVMARQRLIDEDRAQVDAVSDAMDARGVRGNDRVWEHAAAMSQLSISASARAAATFVRFDEVLDYVNEQRGRAGFEEHDDGDADANGIYRQPRREQPYADDLTSLFRFVGAAGPYGSPLGHRLYYASAGYHAQLLGAGVRTDAVAAADDLHLRELFLLELVTFYLADDAMDAFYRDHSDRMVHPLPRTPPTPERVEAERNLFDSAYRSAWTRRRAMARPVWLRGALDAIACVIDHGGYGPLDVTRAIPVARPFDMPGTTGLTVAAAIGRADTVASILNAVLARWRAARRVPSIAAAGGGGLGSRITSFLNACSSLVGRLTQVPAAGASGRGGAILFSFGDADGADGDEDAPTEIALDDFLDTTDDTAVLRELERLGRLGDIFGPREVAATTIGLLGNVGAGAALYASLAQMLEWHEALYCGDDGRGTFRADLYLYALTGGVPATHANGFLQWARKRASPEWPLMRIGPDPVVAPLVWMLDCVASPDPRVATALDTRILGGRTGRVMPATALWVLLTRRLLEDDYFDGASVTPRDMAAGHGGIVHWPRRPVLVERVRTPWKPVASLGEARTRLVRVQWQPRTATPAAAATRMGPITMVDDLMDLLPPAVLHNLQPLARLIRHEIMDVLSS